MNKIWMNVTHGKSIGLLMVLFLLGCEKDAAQNNGARTLSDSDSGGTVSTDSDTGIADTGEPLVDTESALVDTNPVDTGTVEICDKIDNDNNGIIDDVDVGGDGICDCLNIGTIGEIGPWGDEGANIFKTWLDSRSDIPAEELGDQRITPELIAGLNVIVVLRADTSPLTGNDGVTTEAHHAFDTDEVAAINDWVRRGGGLMTTAGYQGDEFAEVANVNLLLAPFGLRYQTDYEFFNLSGMIQTWAVHPITEGITAVETVNGVEPDPANGTALAWGDNETVALVAAEEDDGHVVVFGDEWITYDTLWQDIEDQQVELLWLNMIKWLTSEKECQVPIPDIIAE